MANNQFFKFFVLALTLMFSVLMTGCFWGSQTYAGPGGTTTSRRGSIFGNGYSTSTTTTAPLRDNPNFDTPYTECRENYESVNALAIQCEENANTATCRTITEREGGYRAYMTQHPDQFSSEQINYLENYVFMRYRLAPEITSVCRNDAMREYVMAMWGGLYGASPFGMLNAGAGGYPGGYGGGVMPYAQLPSPYAQLRIRAEAGVVY